MRLIDADELHDIYTGVPNGLYTTGHIVTAIDECKTVDAATVAKDTNVPDKWVSVKDRMPAETHSIFWPWYGRKEWSNAMWREQSDKVLVTVTFKDGTRLVTTGETHDGEWHTSISKTLNPIVTHWMQMPEPPKEDKP